MKILLLYCSDYSIARFGLKRKEFPPIGLLYLAAACEKNKIEVEIKDLSRIDEGSIPNSYIIGLSINSSYIYPAFYRRIKEIRSKCIFLLIGGQHATLFPKETLKELNADYVMVGEGEFILPELIKTCYLEHKKDDPVTHIKGVYNNFNIDSADYDEKFRIKDLDQLAFPARHLLPREEIVLDSRIPHTDVLSTNIITSRGCPYTCNFCGNIYKGFAFRSGKNVEEEIRFILKNYPEIGGLVFLDENLFFNKKHAADIIHCMSLFDLKWTCNARVDGYTCDILPMLKDSGCVEIKYGIESGSQKILDNMHKGITIQQIERTLKCTYNSGIKTKCFLMYGFPGDNCESAYETIGLIERNRLYIDRVNLFSFSPVPNSPIYNSMKCRDFSWEDYRIYHQLKHWWGDNEEYQEVKRGYKLLKDYIMSTFGDV